MKDKTPIHLDWTCRCRRAEFVHGEAVLELADVGRAVYLQVERVLRRAGRRDTAVHRARWRRRGVGLVRSVAWH